ncbi:MAG: ABC transporter ATP-binding protein [Actinomycetota bacterium]
MSNDRVDPTRLPIDMRMVATASFAALLQITAIVPVPFLVREIVDDLLAGESGSTVRLVILGGSVIALQVLSAVGTVGVRTVVARAAAAHGDRLRKWVHDALLRRSVPALRSVDDASLVQASIALPTRIEEGTNMVLGQIVPSAFMITGIIAVLVVLNWQLTVVLILLVPLLTLAQRVGRARMRRRLADRTDREAVSMRTAMSLIERLETVRAPGTSEAEQRRFDARSEDLARASAAVQRDRSVLITANTTAVVIAVTVLLVVGGVAIDAGRLTIGQFLAFYAGVAILRAPTQSLGTALTAVDSARDARSMLRDLDRSLGPAPLDGGDIPDLSRGISVRDVHFAYGEAPVLRGVDLDLAPGTLTALVGANGAGKTTLVHLLLGLYEPDTGTIHAGGVPYADLDTTLLRAGIGVSFQRGALAEASVLDNITYGRTFSEAEVVDAMVLADLLSVVEGLDDGVSTVVGPGGRRLSRGQEQRIELARAAIGRPSVLILDEPTNHLDPEAVSQFLAELIDQPHQPAILVVSHDRRALDLADRVIELRDGRIRHVEADQSAR